MNGEGAFNGHILVDKLAKLNSSQQSIETLSHWCIFHRKKAKQVVETWEQQFHCSSREQRLSFLYLANDILQNSRRKGMEFVGEFWKVLPHALNDLIENGDESGRKAALRLVDIWEERKVFTPRGQTLKEDFLGRNRNGRNISYKLKQPNEDMLQKLISSYRHASDSYDEDSLFGKCKTAVSAVEKVQTEIGDDFKLGTFSDSEVSKELQLQHSILRDCIEQLKAAESSRTTLVSHLREALNEQELKIGQLRNQLQVAQVRYAQVESLLMGEAPPPPPLLLDEVPPPPPLIDDVPPPPPPDSDYSEAPPPPDYPPESSSSMPYYVPPSLASESIIAHSTREDHNPDSSKRLRFDNGGNSLRSVPCYQPQLPLPPLSFPHPETMYQPQAPPQLPHSLVLPPPPPPPAFGYGTTPAPVQPPMPRYPMVGVPPYPGPPNLYPFQGSDGAAYFGQPPTHPL